MRINGVWGEVLEKKDPRRASSLQTSQYRLGTEAWLENYEPYIHQF